MTWPEGNVSESVSEGKYDLWRCYASNKPTKCMMYYLWSRYCVFIWLCSVVGRRVEECLSVSGSVWPLNELLTWWLLQSNGCISELFWQLHGFVLLILGGGGGAEASTEIFKLLKLLKHVYKYYFHVYLELLNNAYVYVNLLLSMLYIMYLYVCKHCISILLMYITQL